MSKRIYVDTNIYLNYFNEEKIVDNFAEDLFVETLKCRFSIILSDHLLNELRRQIPGDKCKILFEALKNKIIKVKATERDIELARKLPMHMADAIHLAIAKNNFAECLVTRDKHLINNNILQSYRPEELV